MFFLHSKKCILILVVYILYYFIFRFVDFRLKNINFVLLYLFEPTFLQVNLFEQKSFIHNTCTHEACLPLGYAKTERLFATFLTFPFRLGYLVNFGTKTPNFVQVAYIKENLLFYMTMYKFRRNCTFCLYLNKK